MTKGTDEIVDPRVLERLRVLENRSGQEGLVGRLVHSFLLLGPVRIESLRQSLASGDGDALVMTAHTLRGSAGNLGATELSALLRCIEEATGRGAMEKVKARLLELDAAWERVAAALVEGG